VIEVPFSVIFTKNDEWSICNSRECFARCNELTEFANSEIGIKLHKSYAELFAKFIQGVLFLEIRAGSSAVCFNAGEVIYTGFKVVNESEIDPLSIDKFKSITEAGYMIYVDPLNLNAWKWQTKDLLHECGEAAFESRNDAIHAAWCNAFVKEVS